MTEPTVHIYSSRASANSVFIANITAQVANFTRSVRLDGGYWIGTFDLLGEPKDLIRVFNEWLGYHLIEQTTAISWEGMIYEMEIAHAGVRRRISLEPMYNAVRVRRDDVPSLTAWAVNQPSINRFGRKELVIKSVSPTSGACDQLRDKVLAETGWPQPQAVAFTNNTGRSTLRVTVMGYIATMNWRYSTYSWSGNPSINSVLQYLFANDIQFITGYVLDNYPLTISDGWTDDTRVYDAVKLLISYGTVATAKHVVTVTAGPHYRVGPVDMTPRFYLRNGVLYGSPASSKSLNPYSVYPAVARDLSWDVPNIATGTIFQSRQDLLIEEVNLNSSGQVALKLADEAGTNILNMES